MKMARLSPLSVKVLIWSFYLQIVLAFTLQSAPENRNLTRNPVTARSLYEQYTLGQMEDGAKIIYTYQYMQAFNESQPEISLDYHYPDVEDGEEIINGGDNAVIITQIDLFVKSQDGSETQAYVTQGGIGENNISLQILATNTNLLSYILIIYGKSA